MKSTDNINYDTLSEEKLENLHDEMHTKFNQLLAGNLKGWTFRQIYNKHSLISKALIRAGGQHITSIDQLDNIQTLEAADEKEVLIKEIKDFNPSKANDKELLGDHKVIHQWYELIKSGKRLRLLDGKEITCEVIKSLHDNIVKEMLKRKIPHSSPIYCEENLSNKKEFILKRYIGENGELKDFWGIKLENKSFEMNENPLKKDIVYSIKKKLELKGEVIDQGEFEILQENENLLSVRFRGEDLKEILNFKRNNVNSNVWKLSKKGANEELSQEYGSSLSNDEIKKIHFLNENKVGASEIANILSRPVQTVYGWIGKLKN